MPRRLKHPPRNTTVTRAVLAARAANLRAHVVDEAVVTIGEEDGTPLGHVTVRGQVVWLLTLKSSSAMVRLAAALAGAGVPYRVAAP